MDRYCVMGNPVAHSKSPWIHARFAELTGEAIDYRHQLVPLDGFQQAVREFRAQGGVGCNVTVPFKFDAFAVPGVRHSARAELAGACNTLAFDADGGVRADNTDGIGLVRDITVNAGVPIAGRRLLLVGAGGAGAGVLGPIIEAGPASITLTNRSAEKAGPLLERHAELAGWTDLHPTLARAAFSAIVAALIAIGFVVVYFAVPKAMFIDFGPFHMNAKHFGLGGSLVSGIGVVSGVVGVAPSAGGGLGVDEDDEVVVAELSQVVAGAQPCGSGADDDDPHADPMAGTRCDVRAHARGQKPPMNTLPRSPPPRLSLGLRLRRRQQVEPHVGQLNRVYKS